MCIENLSDIALEKFIKALKVRQKVFAIYTADKKWMQKVTKDKDFKKGSFTEYARTHGGLDEDGKINHSWAEKIAKDKSVSSATRHRANLYLVFMKSKN